MLAGTGNYNTALGDSALRNGTTPSYNTVVGGLAGTTITSGSNLTVIGYDAEPSSATATNEITLGDANVTDVRIPGVGFYIDNGNVGIGTASPNKKLEIKETSSGAVTYPLRITNKTNATGTGAGIEFEADTSGNIGAQIYVNRDSISGPRHSLRFSAFGSPSTGANALTILDDGNVGIGKTSPAKKLDVNGEIRASTGILFGTDTAAANTLDDYEEGSFVPGIAFGGGTTGITYDQNFGRYTKIGELVFVKVRLTLTSKGTDTGNATITGLPFTINSENAQNSGATVGFSTNLANLASAPTIAPNPGSTIGYLFDWSASRTTNLDDTNFTDSSGIHYSMWYRI